MTIGDTIGLGGYGGLSSFGGSGWSTRPDGTASVSGEYVWMRRGGRTAGLMTPGANRTCRLRIGCTSEVRGSGEGERV